MRGAGSLGASEWDCVSYHALRFAPIIEQCVEQFSP
jgi:hypothetical protein